MRIGQMAALCGVSPRSLRHYEDVGLLRTRRTAGGQRVYALDDVDRVVTIQHLLAGGLPTVVIKDLLPCLDAAADERTGHLEEQLAHQVRHLRERRRDLARQLSVLEDLLTDRDAGPSQRSG